MIKVATSDGKVLTFPKADEAVQGGDVLRLMSEKKLIAGFAVGAWAYFVVGDHSDAKA